MPNLVKQLKLEFGFSKGPKSPSPRNKNLKYLPDIGIRARDQAIFIRGKAQSKSWHDEDFFDGEL